VILNLLAVIVVKIRGDVPFSIILFQHELCETRKWWGAIPTRAINPKRLEISFFSCHNFLFNTHITFTFLKVESFDLPTISISRGELNQQVISYPMKAPNTFICPVFE